MLIPNTYPIPPDGPQSPLFAVVGDAGGRMEQLEHRPFVGRPGQLLDSVFESLNIPRQNLYITYLVKERPANDSPASYFHNNQFTPTGLEWRKILLTELAALNTKAILAVGYVAMRALLGPQGHSSINKLRGSPFNIPELPGKVIIPTLHPSDILKNNYLGRYFLAADINKINKLAENGLSPIPQREIITNPTFQQAQDYLTRCRKTESFAFDIETDYDSVVCIAFSCDTYSGISIPWGNYNKKANKFEWKLLYQDIKYILEHPAGDIVTQNGNYDTFVLSFRHGINTKLSALQDTMVAHHIMYPDLPKSLAMLTSLYTLEPFYKDDGNDAKAIGDFTFYQEYNAKDAIVTLQVWNNIKDMLYPRWIETYNSTMQNLPALQSIQQQGFQIDLARRAELRKHSIEKVHALQVELDTYVSDFLSNKLQPEVAHLNTLLALRIIIKKEKTEEKKQEARELTKQITKLRTRLRQWNTKKDLTGVWYLNFNSSNKVKEYFYELRGAKPIINRKTKRATVDEDAMKKLSKANSTRKAFDEAKLIVSARQEQKLISTYYDAELLNERYYTSFNVRGTKFGRFSASQLFFRLGGNVQNLPPIVRQIFIPDKVV